MTRVAGGQPDSKKGATELLAGEAAFSMAETAGQAAAASSLFSGKGGDLLNNGGGGEGCCWFIEGRSSQDPAPKIARLGDPAAVNSWWRGVGVFSFCLAFMFSFPLITPLYSPWIYIRFDYYLYLSL